jgi:hypothetical protein
MCPLKKKPKDDMDLKLVTGLTRSHFGYMSDQKLPVNGTMLAIISFFRAPLTVNHRLI